MTLISMSYGEGGDGVVLRQPRATRRRCRRRCRHPPYRPRQLLEELLEVVVDLAFGEHFLREKTAGSVKRPCLGTLRGLSTTLTSSGSVAWILSSISLRGDN